VYNCAPKNDGSLLVVWLGWLCF